MAHAASSQVRWRAVRVGAILLRCGLSELKKGGAGQMSVKQLDAPGEPRGARLFWSTASPVLIVWLIAFALALVMAFVVSSNSSFSDVGFDPYFFGEMGRSIADGNGFEGFGSLITRRAPLYPILIGGVFVVSSDSTQLMLFVHCLLFAGTAALACDLGRRHFNKRTGVIAGLLCTLHPLLIRYVPSLHLETFLTFLVTLMIWFTYRFWQRPTVVNGALVGVVAGAATLTKAVALFYPVVFVAAILITIRAARRRGLATPVPWRAMAVMFLSLGLTIAPWTIRNYGTTNHFVLVSSGTSDAFLRGFIFSRLEFVTLQKPPYTDAENESNAYFSRLAEEAGTVWERDDYETDQILNEEAKRRLLNEPLQVARKTAVGLFAFWYQLTSLANSLLVLAAAVVAWTLAIIGWRRARSESLAVWPFLLPVFYLNIVLALLLALGRYSAPILPALLIVSAYGVDTLLARWWPKDA
jgi:4-amino-4-deoxy-L-arabinose transferase-like glycosyltransferase